MTYFWLCLPGISFPHHLTFNFSRVLTFLKRFYLFIFRERGKEGERREEKHDVQEKQLSVAFLTPLTGDLACNPGMCPDWELNWQPFSPQASTQSTESHQQRVVSLSFKYTSCTKHIQCKNHCLLTGVFDTLIFIVIIIYLSILI